MKATPEMLNLFYRNLGKLFYAIAAADKVVREDEINSLKEIVKSEWLRVDDVEDDFGSDSAFQIEIVFDWLVEQDLPAAECFSDFEFFINEHDNLFTSSIKKLIWKTANSIASAFSGKNKSELIMLAKLSELLNKKLTT